MITDGVASNTVAAVLISSMIQTVKSPKLVMLSINILGILLTQSK